MVKDILSKNPLQEVARPGDLPQVNLEHWIAGSEIVGHAEDDDIMTRE